ncbi:hypothetical protein NDU88_002250 [Pleurodeles waltl]|uniref:Uncharacterized protein n=1 Tax=Pleurodeles waltl TaxID=8319 RepID=A0AAV7VA12_PLEWA|nr:hypothetical protein NDU88_002250 [Pleurodeles waltl]
MRQPGTCPAPQGSDPEAQPQPQQSRPTPPDDPEAAPSEVATHTSPRRSPVRKSPPEAFQLVATKTEDPPGSTMEEKER